MNQQQQGATQPSSSANDNLTKSQHPPAPGPSPEDKSFTRRFMGAAAGNLLEYFDFFVYLQFAHYFTSNLTVPTWSAFQQQLYVWSVFALSFFIRLGGSWCFGRIGDRFGRKRAMIWSVSLMTLCCVLFALLPTYNQVGALAPLLLAAVRLLQGFSMGGEYGSVSSYISELSQKGRRYVASSLLYVMAVGGLLLASLILTVLLSTIGEDGVTNGGWRIPFAIGAVLSLLCLRARLKLIETLTVDDMTHESSGSLKTVLTEYLKPFVLVILLTGSAMVMYYIFTGYMQEYLISLGVHENDTSHINNICLFIFMIAQPVCGMLADRIGAKAMMIIFCVLSIVLLYPVMMVAFPHFSDNNYMLGVLLTVMLLISALASSVNPVLTAGLFPAHIRNVGQGVSFGIGLAVFGGTVNPVALAFKDGGWEGGFYILATVILIIGLICSLMLPKQSPYLDKEVHN